MPGFLKIGWIWWTKDTIIWFEVLSFSQYLFVIDKSAIKNHWNFFSAETILLLICFIFDATLPSNTLAWSAFRAEMYDYEDLSKARG